MAELSGMQVPTKIAERFDKFADDAQGVKNLGIEIATELGEELVRRGAPGLHFYTMNSAESTVAIAKNLGLVNQ
jgi:methylenetetrahydrofolate reductase (NADPH)